jgi:hypothetical protein
VTKGFVVEGKPDLISNQHHFIMYLSWLNQQEKSDLYGENFIQ